MSLDWLPVPYCQAATHVGDAWESMGFRRAYRATQGNTELLDAIWVARRASALAELQAEGGRWWWHGAPTGRHLRAAAWAWSPTPERLMAWLRPHINPQGKFWRQDQPAASFLAAHRWEARDLIRLSQMVHGMPPAKEDAVTWREGQIQTWWSNRLNQLPAHLKDGARLAFAPDLARLVLELQNQDPGQAPEYARIWLRRFYQNHYPSPFSMTDIQAIHSPSDAESALLRFGRRLTVEVSRRGSNGWYAALNLPGTTANRLIGNGKSRAEALQALVAHWQLWRPWYREQSLSTGWQPLPFWGASTAQEGKLQNPAQQKLWGLTHPPIWFASGSNSVAEIIGLSEAQHPIGVSIAECGEGCMRALIERSGNLPVFVDSGAFSEMEFQGGVPRLVAPISDMEWHFRLDQYQRLAQVLGSRLYLVAPDRVGDQTETLRRLRRFLPQLRSLMATGAHLLVPLQHGEASITTFHRQVSDLLGSLAWIPAIPSKKEAIPLKELAEWLDAMRPEALHLLGLGEASPRNEAILSMIARVVPSASVSGDSTRLRAMVGHTGGPGGGPRAITLAQMEAVEDLNEETWGETALIDRQGDPLRLSYTDMILFPSEWMSGSERQIVAGALGLERMDAYAWISDPSAFLQTPDTTGSPWGENPFMDAALDAAWSRWHRKQAATEARRRAVRKGFS